MKEKQYKVLATENIFNEYNKVSQMVKNLNCIVQNEGTVLTQESYYKWCNDANKVVNDLVELIKRTAAEHVTEG